MLIDVMRIKAAPVLRWSQAFAIQHFLDVQAAAKFDYLDCCNVTLGYPHAHILHVQVVLQQNLL